MAYTRVKKIARGTFGIVDEVVDGNGQHFARKTFDDPVIRGTRRNELFERFCAEAGVLASIKHPNILSLHESHLDADPAYLILELASQSLADALRQKQELKDTVVMHILAGLEALHAQGLCHRDLCPPNILQLGSGNEHRWVLADFGLCIEEGSDQRGGELDGGTRNYAAPELEAPGRIADRRADIYGVGKILGDLYPGGDSPMAPIIEICTQANPEDRYQDVGALRAAMAET